MARQLVYVLEGDPASYKIGRTRNLRHRLAILQTGHRVELKVVRTWVTPLAPVLETFLQRRFFAANERGEWFIGIALADVDTAVEEWFGGVIPRDVLDAEEKSLATRRRPYIRARRDHPAHPLLIWRERYHVGQAQVREACGMSQATLSKIENWQRIPRGDHLERLMDYTGLPVTAFVLPKRFLRENPDFGDRSTSLAPAPPEGSA